MNNTTPIKEISDHEATVENLVSTILEKEKIIKSLMENSQSMGETNRVMGQRLLRYEAALKEIAQKTGNGDYLNDMLDMKLTATNALKLPS